MWLDVFAITQHAGEAQAHDLTQLEPTIAKQSCTTLMVLDQDQAVPLSRCWCIFEVYATLLHSNGRHGKLQVRAGRADPVTGEFFPCVDRDSLALLASTVDASNAGATVAADKAMILERLSDLARTSSGKLSGKPPPLRGGAGCGCGCGGCGGSGSSGGGNGSSWAMRDHGGTAELNRKLQRAVRHGW